MDRELTEQQKRFVIAFASEAGAIGNASEAARRAGYSERSAGEIGRQLLEKDHIRTAIDAENRRQISGTLATKAVAVLERILDDEQAPLRTRLDAAKTILDRGGIIAPRSPDPMASEPKRLEAMTPGELEAFIRGVDERLIASDGRRPNLAM